MLYYPENYRSVLTIRETEVAIKLLKDAFEQELAQALHLTRVSAPLFVQPETGLNDNLSGVERPVRFGIKEQNDAVCEIVHSLAKWKRYALARYGFLPGEGLYTDMNAIRRDEETDNLHSLYVDQWDWECVIEKKDRTVNFLKEIVRKEYTVFRKIEDMICEKYSYVTRKLPEEIFFITSQELYDRYPDLTAKERENAICREKKAVFLMQIGGALQNGAPHDGRAPDYDDWSLNGDILLYYPLFDAAVELSSMGIRVDEEALVRQLKIAGCYEQRKDLAFQKALLEGKLPYTVGGGIGQSRICMYFLDKAHIGEVQSSIWPQAEIESCSKHNIFLL